MDQQQNGNGAASLLDDVKRALECDVPADPEGLRAVVAGVMRTVSRLWSDLNPSFNSDAWYPISALLTEHWSAIQAHQSQVLETEWHSPWIDLQSTDGQFVHPADLAHVTSFNAALDGKSDRTLVTSAWPEPWMGPAADASVLVLGANPGWAGDIDAEAQFRLRELARANLTGREPMVWLDEAADGSPASEWFRSRLLKDVLGVGGIDERRVAQSLAMVDFHGYHAVRWQPLPVTLPTQHATFALVRERLAADALIVLTRCAFEWLVAIPELAGHPNVCQTNSRQNARLSPRNIGEEGWSALLDRLR